MTKLEMTKEFKLKFSEFRIKKKKEADKVISDTLSKYAIWISGGFLLLGLIAGRVSR